MPAGKADTQNYFPALRVHGINKAIKQKAKEEEKEENPEKIAFRSLTTLS